MTLTETDGSIRRKTCPSNILSEIRRKRPASRDFKCVSHEMKVTETRDIGKR